MFPARRLIKNSGGDSVRRHIAESTVQKAIGAATGKANLCKKTDCRILRRSFAVRLMENHCDIRRLQNLLGHKALKTTVAYTHLLDNFNDAVRSPLDFVEYSER